MPHVRILKLLISNPFCVVGFPSHVLVPVGLPLIGAFWHFYVRNPTSALEETVQRDRETTPYLL